MINIKVDKFLILNILFELNLKIIINFLLLCCLDNLLTNNEIVNNTRHEYIRTPSNSSQNMVATSIYSNYFFMYSNCALPPISL